MKRYFYFLASFCFLLLWSSCRKDFDFTPTEGALRFSKDTVYLDTVFTNIGSSTYTLKVYNTSDDNILIPKIKLQERSKLQLPLKCRWNDRRYSAYREMNLRMLNYWPKTACMFLLKPPFDIQDLVSNDDTQYLYTDAIEFGLRQQCADSRIGYFGKRCRFYLPTTNYQPSWRDHSH